jgi:hypothetical protein
LNLARENDGNQLGTIAVTIEHCKCEDKSSTECETR